MWNNSFINETGNYGVSAELVKGRSAGSMVVNFYVRKNNTPDAWNVTLRVPDTREIGKVTEPSEWIWQRGVAILDWSSRVNVLRNGEFVVTPDALKRHRATLAELSEEA